MNPEQKPVAHRQAVDGLVAASSAFGPKATAVDGNGVGCVQAAPVAPQEAPCEFGVFAVGEKTLGEDLAVRVGDILQRRPAIEGGGAGAAENPHRAGVTAVVRFAGAAVEVPTG